MFIASFWVSGSMYANVHLWFVDTCLHSPMEILGRKEGNTLASWVTMIHTRRTCSHSHRHVESDISFYVKVMWLKWLVFWIGPPYLIGMSFGEDQRATILKTTCWKRIDLLLQVSITTLHSTMNTNGRTYVRIESRS